jgi:sec-independent protein translocase protein TatA
MLPSFGPTELIIILVIVLLIFGPGKIANLGGSLGKSIRDFKTGLKDDEATAEPKLEKTAAAKDTQDAEVR